LQEAKQHGAGVVLHCGDLIAPSTLYAVAGLGLPVHLIHGNNTGDLFHLHRWAADPEKRLHYHGQDATLTLHNRRIFMVHYPHYAKGMAATGEFDLVCNGHEHKAVIEQLPTIKGGLTVRVDPGSVAGIGGPATYVLGDLERMHFEIRTVPPPA
jgi:predicted phosphodiesterase